MPAREQPGPKPIFFRSGPEFRRWLGRHHHRTTELWLGFYKANSSRKGITYREALDEALCFGWIDGLVRGVDESCFVRRFTPRKKKSIWSRVNITRAQELKGSGRMAEAGLKVFEARDPQRSGVYSFENAERKLDAAGDKLFRANPKAWAFFQSQAPWYRRTAIWLVVSAKKEATRTARLRQLIRDSEQQRRIKQLISPAKQKKAGRAK